MCDSYKINCLLIVLLLHKYIILLYFTYEIHLEINKIIKTKKVCDQTAG
jgi:hypothetical protein